MDFDFDTIFLQARELAGAEECAAFLSTACGGDAGMRARIEAMLADADEADAFFVRGHHDLAQGEAAPPPAEEPGGWIGPYKLLERIGEGGFGTVWVAGQEKPLQRRVALKIIKPGMDTREVIARFGQERQALAMMDHPNIAKVLDAGATPSGRPYFVMELVRGTRITDYCDEAQLPAAHRLELFIQVCQAVQHAHQKGIIHRDLKPSNILVTLHDGVPVSRVIDFGIAKATQETRLTEDTVYTRFEQMIGTPLYMSPEQAEMSGLDIDTRSDIYSLGVLLYELLTGRTPFDPAVFRKAGLDEMRRLIREQTPPKPSTALQTMAAETRTKVARHRRADASKIAGRQRGDLDWIVMKALEKDRTRRYETASGLAQDLRRHLAGEPVLAAAPTAAYRFGKFARRHKGILSGAALIAVILLAATGVSLHQAAAARKAEVLANARRTEAQASEMRAVAAERDALAKAAAAREARKKYEAVTGFLYGALELQEKTLTLLRTLAGTEHPNTLQAMGNLAGFYSAAGRQDEALKLQEETLALLRTLEGPEHPNTLRAMGSLAKAYSGAGQREEAVRMREEILAIRLRVNGTEHSDTLKAMRELADALMGAGQRERALALLAETVTHTSARDADSFLLLEIAALQVWFGSEADYLSTCRRMLTLANETGDPTFAERTAGACCLRPSSDPQFLDAVLAVARRAVESGKNHDYLPYFLMTLGIAEYRHGNHAAAGKVLSAAWERSHEFATMRSLNRLYLAMNHLRLGNGGEARRWFSEAEAGMIPFPADERQPLADGFSEDRLYCWLAYREAKALFQSPAPAASEKR